ncbi:MAG: hypothetical protein GX282_07220 [Campylobacteraceae bacterium]|nr:hypothetical protein [Campylobacteraceae bacterium]
MLEHYEIVELEEKWKKYKDSSKIFQFNKFSKFKNFKLDKTISFLLILISASLGAVIWLISPNNATKESVLEQTSTAKIEKNIESGFVEEKEDEDIKQKTVKNEFVENPAPEQENRGTLTFSDIGISSSVDAGGFIINNRYKDSNQDTPTLAGIEPSQSLNQIPKDEIIDFGNPPSAPRASAGTRASSSSSGKVVIQTSPMKVSEKSLEEKFYSTNDIVYSIRLSENAYKNKNYNEAIKWALISNELDKNNPQSWILFAKATYKKGNKEDALIALKNFDGRVPTAEVKALIKQIQNGDL